MTPEFFQIGGGSQNCFLSSVLDYIVGLDFSEWVLIVDCLFAVDTGKAAVGIELRQCTGMGNTA